MKLTWFVLLVAVVVLMTLMMGPLQVVGQALRSTLAFLAGIMMRDMISFMKKRRQALIATLFLATFLAGFLTSYTLVSIS